MSEQTTYSQAGMQSGITSLRNAHRRLTELLDELKGQLNQSLGKWEDNAREAYQIVQVQWDQSAAKQKSIVERLPVLLSQISEGYDATEKQNSGVWAV